MREILIDKADRNTKENMRYRGAGMVSGNNSSRLLLDYKAQHPEVYHQLLEYMFGDGGVGVTHLKIEMGSDINSSSGTEPAVKRSAGEKPDVTRGAGYQLAADAKKINPDLTLDMLWWSEPRWVSDAEDVYGARYRWFKETLDAAYAVYGLKFDYVSVSQNERAFDPAWVKYAASRLKSEPDCPYDYARIKLVSADEEGAWHFAEAMGMDEALLQAVDVIGSHYTSASTRTVQMLAEQHGKEVWFSEGCPPMNYAQGTGMQGVNGTLDIANRIIAMYPQGKMTLYEYQPVVSAYYDGACYCHKQLISACDPWSGHYTLDSGFYMSLHFSQFFKKGWAFVDHACCCDGKPGSDRHTIVDAVYSYMTGTDMETGDYSTVIVNSTAEPIVYAFRVSGLEKASAPVGVWETRDAGGDRHDIRYFQKIARLVPEEQAGSYCYQVTVQPASIVTVSTVTPAETAYPNGDIRARSLLELPYADDFAYPAYPAEYLSSRGNAPRYTTDQGGAFEVEHTETGNLLVQQITAGQRAKEWGYTPDPVTCLGDDRWYNYSVSADVMLTPADDPAANYAGIGLRYTLACEGCSGYWLQLFEDGSWRLNANSIPRAQGRLAQFDSRAVHRLRITAVNDLVSACIDGVQVAGYRVCGESLIGAGRAALYSSYHRNSFGDLRIEPADGADTYITRFDDTDPCFAYAGQWTHQRMSSFKNYKRTISKGQAGASVTVRFTGSGFAITGETGGDTLLSVQLDACTPVLTEVYKTGPREISCRFDGLENGAHEARICVISGEYCIDGMQIPYQ